MSSSISKKSENLVKKFFTLNGHKITKFKILTDPQLIENKTININCHNCSVKLTVYLYNENIIIFYNAIDFQMHFATDYLDSRKLLQSVQTDSRLICPKFRSFS